MTALLCCAPRAEPGSYILWLSIPSAVRLPVGALGVMTFPAGLYGYVGSALGSGGVAARVARHLRRERRNHWHIDYLTGRYPVREVWFAHATERLEHQWAARLAATGGTVISPGFGASDCHCAAHLLRFSAMPEFDRFSSRQDRPDAFRSPELYCHRPLRNAD